MYVHGNIEARLFNHCCSRKETIITYSVRVFVDLRIRHARRMCHIVICRLTGCKIFFHTTS